MNYKKIIYENYLKNHTLNLYGSQTLQSIRSNFVVWQKYFKHLLPEAKNVYLLDIGCGSGSFVYFLQSLGYQHVEGVDISQQQIDAGKQLGISGLYCNDIQSFLRESRQKYDCIIARDVMEHLTKDEIFEVLDLVKNALNKGGTFILQSPNGEGLNYAALYYGDFTHEVAFTRTSLQQIFLNTGFSDVACFPTGPVAHGFFSTLRWALWQLIVFKAKFYKAVETGSFTGIYTQNIIAKAVNR